LALILFRPFVTKTVITVIVTVIIIIYTLYFANQRQHITDMKNDITDLN